MLKPGVKVKSLFSSYGKQDTQTSVLSCLQRATVTWLFWSLHQFTHLIIDCLLFIIFNRFAFKYIHRKNKHILKRPDLMGQLIGHHVCRQCFFWQTSYGLSIPGSIRHLLLCNTRQSCNESDHEFWLSYHFPIGAVLFWTRE